MASGGQLALGSGFLEELMRLVAAGFGVADAEAAVVELGAASVFADGGGEEDRLYALFHLIVFCGLRRGEACGQK
ncbi:hypothetical protein [Streptomyces sp. NPDC017991]|uniref:hypothetical protein n=1 Tax=Streptomyces sp. NPDC017991 TaxID=3365026 RepID=UPI0037A4E6BC